MLIDFHTHCFPDTIAHKAIEKLSYSAGGLKPYTDGTISGLKESMKKHNVDISVVMNIATNEKQQKNVNDFASQCNNEKDIFAFGSVYPLSESAMEQLDYIKALGLKGIKFHPEYQNFFVDDERMKPIYKKIASLNLITIFHAGSDHAFLPPYHATPERLKKALSWFDGAPVIAAHWGSMAMAEDVTRHLCGENIYFDTSYGYSTIPKPFVQKIIEKHGVDKLLFGTDTPWHTPKMEMKLLESMELSNEEMDKIKYKNAKKLLGI